MHQDFLGQQLKAGDFICYPGSGNTKAEYGLILMKVVGLSDNGNIKVERLSVNYPDHRTPKISRRKTTIQSLTKLVRVSPSQNMIDVFEKPDEHADLVAKWLHGSVDIDWDKLTYDHIALAQARGEK